MDFGVRASGIATGVAEDNWEGVQSMSIWMNIDLMLTASTAWMLGGEFRQVPYLAVNHDPQIFQGVVLSDLNRR